MSKSLLDRVDQKQVQAAYRIVLGRLPRKEELTTSNLDNYPHFYDLLDQLFASDEFAAESTKKRLREIPVSPATIVSAFQVLFGRNPKPQGIKLHMEAVKSQWQLINVLLYSEEWKKKYGEYLATRPEKTVTARPPKFRYVFSKSTPRSGHHFLANMLLRYFGMYLRYCEYYQPANCCHSTPCSKAYDPVARNRFFLQKSHDLDLIDEKDLDGFWIVQYRGILTQTQSYFDWALKTSMPGCEDTAAGFRKFAQRELKYFIRFYNKWVVKRQENTLVITYEDLVKHTERELIGATKFISGNAELDDDQLQFAMAQKDTKINTFNSPKAIRDIYSFRYYDPVFFRELEQEVAERCPGYQPPFELLDNKP